MADIPTTPGDDELQQAILARFECVRCGFCCKGDGIVRLTSAEADRMAARLGLKRQDFLKTYAIGLDSRHWILRDRFVPGPNGAPGREQWCIFLERHPDDGLYACRLGDAKPRQCKVFPYDWTNPDSIETCAGLRLAQAKVRREAEAAPAHEDETPAR
jgi:Fe-S-cluster containining protein